MGKQEIFINKCKKANRKGRMTNRRDKEMGEKKRPGPRSGTVSSTRMGWWNGV